jgi:tRNA (guanosine-2'-O-)-methyltransferase
MSGEKTIFDLRSSEELFSKRKLILANEIRVGNRNISADAIIERLEPILTEHRREGLERVISNRSFHLVTVLENIYDRGNVSAVMRSADAFGFLQMHLVDKPGTKFKAANRVSKGTEKWLDVHVHSSVDSVVSSLKSKGYRIFATDLDTDVTIEQIDFTQPMAIVLGNEKDGVSKEMLNKVDGKFRIPMYGFAQSFNISVAGALVLYHARRVIQNRVEPGSELFKQILANYCLRCFDSPEIYFN